MARRISFMALVVLIALTITLLLAESAAAAKTTSSKHSSKPTPKPSPKPHKSSPKPAKVTHTPPHKRSGAISIAQLTTAFAGNCPPQTTGDAITCKDALPFINAAISKYGLKTKGQQAAYIANMAYEGGYLKYDHNLVTHSQGTRSIMPATSLRIFVDNNPSIQKLFPGYPNIDNNGIVDVLIQKKADFEPGAWWAVKGPGCAGAATGLSASQASFTTWEQSCINGGADTVSARAAIYQKVYASI
ncbi:hypothetical protein EDD21DRAFT_90684 [Dissophora ornata]|nr:hypothetical protein BGZ58_008766 [Dissophora ornata]KAI8601991.1 hypothetical protein EDD21DRAFT_90684 [Dissophora ornata]